VTADTYLYEEGAYIANPKASVFNKTVADVNKEYPADDRVVLARYEDSDKRYAYPESRLRGLAHGEV
jgi:hypothetical protein